MWHKDGKIFLKKSENENALRISTQYEIHHLRRQLESASQRGMQEGHAAEHANTEKYQNQTTKNTMDISPSSPSQFSSLSFLSEPPSAKEQQKDPALNDDSFVREQHPVSSQILGQEQEEINFPEIPVSILGLSGDGRYFSSNA